MHPILGTLLTGGIVYTAAFLWALYRYFLKKRNKTRRAKGGVRSGYLKVDKSLQYQSLLL
jgi:hypothetical protein